jgi:hypothetical protein
MLQDKLVWKMFLILHDPYTGKAEVAHDLLTAGLVACELADLIMSWRLALNRDQVLLAPAPSGPPDEIASLVLQAVERHPGTHSVRTWIRVLGEPVYEAVARLAVAAGTVRRQPGRWRPAGRGPARFPAVDLLRAAGPRTGLEHTLRAPGVPRPAAAVLAGVLAGLRLERLVDEERDRSAVKNSIGAAVAALPLDLRAVLSCVESAADASSSLGRGSLIAPMPAAGGSPATG